MHHRGRAEQNDHVAFREHLKVMKFLETKLKGCYVVEPEPKCDERGSFSRIFCKNEFLNTAGIDFTVVQCNTSYNKKRATLRGMHYQTPPFQEVKLVKCIAGAIYDVVVDLRPTSSTFCQWFSLELSSDNHKMLYIPKDFAHGYLTLKNDTEIFYFMSDFYQPDSARGLRWNDPAFGIRWPSKPRMISDRDMNFPDFRK